MEQLPDELCAIDVELLLFDGTAAVPSVLLIPSEGGQVVEYLRWDTGDEVSYVRSDVLRCRLYRD